MFVSYAKEPSVANVMTFMSSELHQIGYNHINAQIQWEELSYDKNLEGNNPSNTSCNQNIPKNHINVILLGFIVFFHQISSEKSVSEKERWAPIYYSYKAVLWKEKSTCYTLHLYQIILLCKAYKPFKSAFKNTQKLRFFQKCFSEWALTFSICVHNVTNALNLIKFLPKKRLY